MFMFRGLAEGRVQFLSIKHFLFFSIFQIFTFTYYTSLPTAHILTTKVRAVYTPQTSLCSSLVCVLVCSCVILIECLCQFVYVLEFQCVNLFLYVSVVLCQCVSMLAYYCASVLVCYCWYMCHCVSMIVGQHVLTTLTNCGVTGQIVYFSHRKETLGVMVSLVRRL